MQPDGTKPKGSTLLRGNLWRIRAGLVPGRGLPVGERDSEARNEPRGEMGKAATVASARSEARRLEAFGRTRADRSGGLTLPGREISEFISAHLSD